MQNQGAFTMACPGELGRSGPTRMPGGEPGGPNWTAPGSRGTMQLVDRRNRTGHWMCLQHWACIVAPGSLV